MSEELFARIAAALERMAPAPLPAPDFAAEAFQWHTGPDRLEPVPKLRPATTKSPGFTSLAKCSLPG